MRKTLLSTLTILSLLFSQISEAQLIDDQVSLSANFASQSFYSLQNGEVANVDNINWDIAVMTDAFNSSILINDNAGAELYLYSSEASAWDNVDTTGMTWTPLHNSEVAWEKGAFTQPQNESDPFDYGWGNYNVVTHVVTGDRVFILKMGNGSYKKVIIESLVLGTYTFKYADLDGSSEVQESVDSSDYASKNFWYYSMQDQAVIDREPASVNWDITFTRFISEIAPGFNYLVAGALQNVDRTASEARPVATAEAAWGNYPMTEDINVIGSDWKYFDMDIFQYVIEDSLSYFVQDVDGNVWQMVFTAFGGSTDGTMAFTKEMISATGIGETAALKFRVFPNPSEGEVTVILPVEDTQAYYTIIDAQGRAVLSDTWTVGFQHHLDLMDVPSGIYLIQIEMEGSVSQQRLIVR